MSNLLICKYSATFCFVFNPVILNYQYKKEATK